MPKIGSLSVVIPMYNEAENVSDIITEAIKIISAITEKFEIIVVDDKSSDATAGFLDAMVSHDRRIKVVHNPARKGLGGALRAGFAKAENEVIFYTDADMPCDLQELRSAITLMERYDADIVSAYRSDDQREGARRYLYSLIYNKLINFIYRINIKDINFSFKLFNKHRLDELKLESEGSFINAELFIKARRAGYKIFVFPATYLPRKKGRSKLDNLNNIMKIILELSIFSKKNFFLFVSSFFNTIGKKTIKGDILGHLAETPLRYKTYAALRMLTCPYEKIVNFVPEEGRIIDLGCGLGLLPFWLRHTSEKRQITGIDCNESRIRATKKISPRFSNNNIHFICGDIVSFHYEDGYDCMLLTDVLYQLSIEDKKSVLKKCFNYLDAEGVLLIKEIGRHPFIKFLWCCFQERIIARAMRLNVKETAFIDSDALVHMLYDVGFNVNVTRIDKGYPYPHLLYMCKKRR